MKKRLQRVLGLIVFLAGMQFSVAQQQVIHIVPFNSGNQSMWGPSTSAFSLNKTWTLLDEGFNEEYTLDLLESLDGAEFGMEVKGKINTDFKFKFKIKGFTSGEVNVNYPINVLLDMPTDYTYDPGDLVTIETSYTLRPGAEIETMYPSAGEASLDMYFDLSAKLSAKVCAFGCTNVPLISQPIDLSNQHVNLFTINQNGVECLSYNGGPPASSTSALPVDVGAEGASPHPPQVLAPATLSDYGLTGTLDVPYVNTSSFTTGPGGRYLYARGQDKYVDLNLDVFQLISSYAPEPYATAIENLSGVKDDYPFNGEIYWNFLSASLDLKNYNKQRFDFTPKVFARLAFPVAVEYSILDGSTVVSSGNSSIINVQVGNDVRYKFPCYFEELAISPRYRITGTFTNKTYDSIPLDFNISGLEFGASIDDIEVIPEIVIPEECVTVGYPCGSWDDPDWCEEEVCTPEVVIPALVFDGFDETIGPLFDETVNLIGIELPWFEDTWNLEGFSQYTRPDFIMRTNPIGITNTSVDVACNGTNSGSINVSFDAVNNAGPISYAWSNGATTQDQTGLAGGTYTLLAVDANGCSFYTGATISEPPLLEGFTSKTDKQCNGSAGDGTIDATIFGGTAPYTYSWSNGATTEDLSGLNAGVYTLTATDANLCTVVRSVTINEPTVLGQSAAITPVNCLNGSDGAIDVTPFGGTLPYNFSWSSSQISEDLTNLTANTYTLTVTDGNACTHIAPYVVTEPPTAVALSAVPIDVSCFGGNNGGVNLTTTGGTPGYTYDWVSMAGGILPYVSEDISNVPASEYTVIATDMNGCQDTLTQIVSQPAAPLSSTPVIVDILCFGDPSGSIDPVIAGGTAPYTYAWSNGSTAASLNGIVAGNYTLNITDFNGCLANYSYTLTQPAAPLDLVLTGTDILCFGDTTGAITSTTTGGTPGYTYVWSNGALTDGISNLTSGNYSVVVTDNNGCTISNNLTLIQPAAPLALSSFITDVDCHGNNSGEINLTIAGGTAPYLKLWSNSATIILSDTTEDLSTQYADDYLVLVTDDHGCTDSLVSTINEPLAPLAITGIIDHVNCFGFNDGAIAVDVTGGTQNYTFAWSSGQGTEDIANVLSGDYTLTVTDANNCTESASFTVEQPIAPLNLTTEIIDVLCFGGTTGSISSTVTGGTSPYDYDWSTMDTTSFIESQLAGTYTLTVTDAQGCLAFTGSTIEQPTQLVVTPTVTDASCFEYSDGLIVLNVSGGIAPYYLNWGNQNDILLHFQGDTLSDLATNNYFVRVRDDNGCVSEQFVFVGEPTPFVSEYTVTDALCYGNSDGAIDVTVMGGTLPYTSSWENGSPTEDLSNLTSGVYSFTILDAQGCIIEDSAFVDQPNVIQILQEIIEVSCIDQTDAEILVKPYGGTPPYNYIWSTGESTADVQGIPPGSYSLTVSDANACIMPFTFEISINPSECLIIPNTFTPNGDDYNDTWVIGNLDLYPDAVVKVFNKWGNEVYDTFVPYTPWDGTHRGNPLPSEVYYYIIVLNNEEENKYAGTITIIR